MVIDINVFRSAIDSLKDKVTTNDEKELLITLKNVLNQHPDQLDFVDLEDHSRYEVSSDWLGIEDILCAIDQYYYDEEIFADRERRERYAKEIFDRVDWDGLSYVLNCKGCDVICEAIDDFLYDKE